MTRTHFQAGLGPMLALEALLLASCAETPNVDRRIAYANQHGELTPERREAIALGRVEVGMTSPVRPFRPRVSPDAEAFQSFLVGLKSVWGGELFREVAREARSRGVDDPAAIEREMRASPAYQYFAWLEHYLQQYRDRKSVV